MVTADALAQRRAVDEVGREEETLRVRGAVLLLLGHVDAHHLPWGEGSRWCPPGSRISGGRSAACTDIRSSATGHRDRSAA